MSKKKNTKRYSRLRPPKWLADLSPHTVKLGRKSYFILFDHASILPKDLTLKWEPNVWLGASTSRKP